MYIHKIFNYRYILRIWISIINGFIRFYISMSVVARPICKFVDLLNSFVNWQSYYLVYLEFRREYFCLNLYTKHCLGLLISRLYLPVYMKNESAFISVLFGDRNIGIAYSYYYLWLGIRIIPIYVHVYIIIRSISVVGFGV